MSYTILADHVEVKLFRTNIMKNLDLYEKSVKNDEYYFPYMTEGSAAFDIYAMIDEPKTIYCNTFVDIPSGIGLHISDDMLSFCMMMLIRSSIGRKGLYLTNSVGLIDSDYQGEIICSIGNRHPEYKPYVINPGDRIAQCSLFPIYRLTHGSIVNDFGKRTDRFTGGFGHTGE